MKFKKTFFDYYYVNFNARLSLLKSALKTKILLVPVN